MGSMFRRRCGQRVSLLRERGPTVVSRAVGASILALLMFSAPAPASASETLRADQPPAGAIWVETLDLSKMAQRRGEPRAGRSIRDQPIRLGGLTYPHGIGTRSISEFVIDLKGVALRFESMVELDDVIKGTTGSVTLEVWADDTLAAASGIMRAGDEPKKLSADLTGVRVLTLLVDDGGDTSNDDEVAWGGAILMLRPDTILRPEPYTPPPEAPPAIAPAVDLLSPVIHGPRITGATPGRPCLFRVPATGQPPLHFSARGLPSGLTLDSTTGIITGSLRAKGKHRVDLSVRGPAGTAQRSLTIVGGADALALTPPMGWNSWNVWGPAVDQEKVLAAAEWLDRSGLAAHGFNYIVIDDAWQGARDAKGEITPNAKFPDMPALARAVHARGLKLGIYSSPGTKTCEEFDGSWQHEEQDAATYAR